MPLLAHAGLALSIGLGALLNACWLLVGLLRRGAYKPLAGWGLFVLQVVAASAVLAVYLLWLSGWLNWLASGHSMQRVFWLVAAVVGAAVVYFGVLLVAGLNLRRFVRK